MIGHFAVGTVLGDLTAEPTILRDMTLLLTDGASDHTALNNDIAIAIAIPSSTLFASALAHFPGCKRSRMCRFRIYIRC